MAEIVRSEGGGLVLDVVLPDAEAHWRKEIAALVARPRTCESVSVPKDAARPKTTALRTNVSQIEDVLQNRADNKTTARHLAPK